MTEPTWDDYIGSNWDNDENWRDWDDPDPADHGKWVPVQRVAEKGAQYAVIYECECGCGETWQPREELPEKMTEER